MRVAPAPTPHLRPPGVILDIARKLIDAGYETWCVGGAVRDALLGQPHLDWDLATAARPEDMRKLFKRTVPLGIEFGTVGVIDPNGRMHEVTTFRRDVRTDGRHAEVEFGVSLNDDLARRDYTINAIAWEPLAKRLHDPFDGQGDLERRLIRAVGNAQDRMREDRLRALRAIRFAARLKFAIEPDTWQAIRDSAPHLGRLSPERVKQELDKTMEQVAKPSEALALWRDSGAFATLIPALADVPEWQLRAIDALPRPGLSTRPMRRALRFSALLAGLGARGAERVLRDLRSSNLEIGTVRDLVGRWERFGGPISAALLAPEPPADAQLRRWAAELGRLRVAPFLRLAAAMWWAELQDGRPAPTPARVRWVYRRTVHVAFRDPLEIGDLAVDGDDLRRAGVPAGPALGRVLNELAAFVVEDPSRNTSEVLLRRAAEVVGAGGSQ